MASAAAADPADVFGAEPADAPSPRVIFGFALMALGMFMAVLDIQIVAASLGQIQAGLNASGTEISWVQTSYLVAEVVMIPLSGFLMRAFGVRNLFAISSVGFVVTSILCATATSLDEMILYRAAQGFVGGAMIPTAYAASFALFPRRYQTQVTVAVAVVLTLAPTIGPTIGGLLTDALNWRWIFLINIVPGVLVTFGVLALVDRGRSDIALLKRIDIAGLLLMALFLGGLDYVLEEGARNEWFEDRLILGTAIMVAFAAVLFLWRSLAAAEPIVNLSAFGNRNFAFGCMLQLAIGMALFGLTYAYPVFLDSVAGFSAGQIGGTVFVTGLTMLLAAPIVGRVARVIDPRFVCAGGFVLLAASAWLSRDITAEWRFDELLLPQILRGFGLIACIVSTTIVAFATLSAERAAIASPLFILMRNIGGAIGLALINTLLIERGYLHWAQLTTALGGGRADVAERVRQLSELAAVRGLDPAAAPLRMLARAVEREAAVLSFADVFHVLTILFAILAIVPLLVRRPPTFETAAAAH